MRDVIRLEALEGDRFELALERLVNGLGFVVNGVWIRIDADGTLCYEAITKSAFPNLTEAAVREAIERAKLTMKRLRNSGPKFAGIAAAHECRVAAIDDCGSGTFEICRELDGRLIWTKELDGAV